jgi:PAS domain S-box-containing protein
MAPMEETGIARKVERSRASRPATRILAVEDDPMAADLIRLLLLDAGSFDVEVADTLAGALERLARGGVDAILLDLNLADSTGLETLSRVHARAPQVPVIVLTGGQEEGLAERAIREGAQDYLPKEELDRGLLVRAIRYSLERKRSENALRKSEERFELMARATNDAVWDWDLSTNRVVWNVGVRRFLGYPPDHVGADLNWWHQHIHPDDRERVMSGVLHVIETGGRFWMEEYRYLAADGSYSLVFDRAYVIRDEQGAAVRVVGAMMDVTDRRRAEEALRETNQMLETLIQASPLGIIVTDADGKVGLWNPAVERMLGWSAAEVVGRPVPDTLTLEGKEETHELRRKSLEGGPFAGVEVSRRRKDGTPVELSVSMAPLRDAQGERRGRMVILADVTGRRLAERQKAELGEQLRQSQKMEAVGRLAGGVAHDFNNLLTAISGFGQLLRGTVAEGTSERSYVDDILSSADRAAALTRQLLAFSRRQVLTPAILDVNRVVRSAESLLRRLIGENIEFGTCLAPDLEAVRADQGQLEQVIMNLVVNARDAMPQGGNITIETRNVDLNGEYRDRHGRARNGPHVLVAVSDTGCGMDEQTRSHLFEPFFTTKEKGKGTGLGLATVYGIIKQSGGDIWVYSEPGKGTSFHIYLPRLAGAPEAPPPAAAPEGPRRGTETILLVEDSEVVRRLAREILARNGYRVLEAVHGENALEVSRAFDGVIDLLMTDVVMPRMGGRELAAHLAAQRPAMKVLYVSGYTEGAITRNGFLDEGMSFLEKPFSPGTVARKVREVLDEGKRE